MGGGELPQGALGSGQKEEEEEDGRLSYGLREAGAVRSCSPQCPGIVPGHAKHSQGAWGGVEEAVKEAEVRESQRKMRSPVPELSGGGDG